MDTDPPPALPMEALLAPGETTDGIIALLAADGTHPHPHAVDSFGTHAARRALAFRHLMSRSATTMLASVTCPAGCGPDLDSALTPYVHPLTGTDTILDEIVETGLRHLESSVNGDPVDSITGRWQQHLDAGGRCGGPCLNTPTLARAGQHALRAYTAMSWELQVDSESAGLTRLMLHDVLVELASDHPGLDRASLWPLVLTDPRMHIALVPDPLAGSDWAPNPARPAGSVHPDDMAVELGIPGRQAARSLVAVVAWLSSLPTRHG